MVEKCFLLVRPLLGGLVPCLVLPLEVPAIFAALHILDFLLYCHVTAMSRLKCRDHLAPERCQFCRIGAKEVQSECSTILVRESRGVHTGNKKES
jgi:hypothetical protein